MSWYNKAIDNNAQEDIFYKDVIDLGFEVIEQSCEQYFNQYGFSYKIIQLQLCKKPDVLIYWHQETRKCDLMRFNKESDIKALYRIKNKEELEMIIKFFKQ